MLTNEKNIILKTHPPCSSSDAYYKSKLNCIRENVRLSRNLIHALYEYYEKAGNNNPLLINKGWKIQFNLGEKTINLMGRNLPALVCEAAIMINDYKTLKEPDHAKHIEFTC